MCTCVSVGEWKYVDGCHIVKVVRRLGCIGNGEVYMYTCTYFRTVFKSMVTLLPSSFSISLRC